MPKGFVLVISSPSGAGKTTIVGRMLKKNKNLSRVITATTRKPRKDEKNGRDYHFWSENKFKKAISEGIMAEWSKVYGYYYGIARKSLDIEIKKGKTPVLVIDVCGAKKVKKIYPYAILVFIMPPSIGELKKRLLKRNDKSGDLKLRLKKSEKEIKRVSMYDYVVVNDKIKNAVDDLNAIITAEKLKQKTVLKGE